MKLLILAVLSVVAIEGLHSTASASAHDDVSRFINSSGLYTRSLLTDVDDGNDALCRTIIRADVDVESAGQHVSITTYAKRDGVVKKNTNDYRVGASTVFEGINAVNVHSVLRVKGHSIEQWDRSSFLDRFTKWSFEKTRIEFVSADTIKVEGCTFHRVR